MPPAKKRKIVDETKVQYDAPLDETEVRKSPNSRHMDEKIESEPSTDSQPDTSTVDQDQARRERFKALQARAVSLLPPTNSERPRPKVYPATIRS